MKRKGTGMGGRGASSGTGIAARASGAAGNNGTGPVIELTEKKQEYFNRVVRQSMDSMIENNLNAKNERESLYRRNRLSVQTEIYADALGISKQDLGRLYNNNAQVKTVAEPKKIYAPSTNTPTTYINNFGEATRRYITSSTYERALKRKDRAFDAYFFGSRR